MNFIKYSKLIKTTYLSKPAMSAYELVCNTLKVLREMRKITDDEYNVLDEVNWKYFTEM